MHSSKHTEQYKNDCFISQAQNTTAFQPNGFLTGIHWLLVTSKGRSALPSAKHCQGQRQNPQSVSIHLYPSDSTVSSTVLPCVWIRGNFQGSKNTIAYTNNELTWLPIHKLFIVL